MIGRDHSGGSVRPNKLRAFSKYFSASILPLPLQASAGSLGLVGRFPCS
ncbi:MAG: hypothetical protein ACK41Y_16045 [Paracoccus hibiscisoli]